MNNTTGDVIFAKNKTARKSELKYIEILWTRRSVLRKNVFF